MLLKYVQRPIDMSWVFFIAGSNFHLFELFNGNMDIGGITSNWKQFFFGAELG